MSTPRSPHGSPQSQNPRRQEWALINTYKAMQFQRSKELQKLNDKQKKRRMKEELDRQINSKNSLQAREKLEDRRYYEYISRKSEQMKEREERQKQQKFMKRKTVEKANQSLLDNMRDSRQHSSDTGYHLEIGVKSGEEHRVRGQANRKQMQDTLDKQVLIKEQEKKYQRVHELQTDIANLKYQDQQLNKLGYHPHFKSQNPYVYDYYKQLERHRKAKQNELNRIIVEEGAAQRRRQEDKKIEEKNQKKAILTNDMKKTLEWQVAVHQQKAEQEKKVNPEELTYGVIGNMFKPRHIPYDKREYSDYLRRQAQEHNQRQIKQKFMSEEEYRINMNQLNKAVGGRYSEQEYLDRSVGAIGENSPKGRSQNLVKEAGPVSDPDSELVKYRIENLRHRQRNSIY